MSYTPHHTLAWRSGPTASKRRLRLGPRRTDQEAGPERAAGTVQGPSGLRDQYRAGLREQYGRMSAATAAASAASSAEPGSHGTPPPDTFLCPISQEIMVDPVVATDGHSYERAEIEKWFTTGKTSPMTNSETVSQSLIPNHALKSMIKEWQGRSDAQCVADLIATVVLRDDEKEVDRQLGALARFVAHRKVVVQPQTLQKLRAVLVGASSAVHEVLRVTEAERGQHTDAKWKRSGKEGKQGTVAAKRQHRCIADSDIAVECKAMVTMAREGREWWRGNNFRVRDKVRGQWLIEAAAAGGLPIAMAWCKSKGWSGHVVDKRASRDIYRMMATQGDSEAQYKLGNCYYQGRGVEEDKAEAVKWYQRAAEQGHSAAQCRLGDCYLHGDGVEDDKAEAVKWFQKAVDQGDSDAQCWLGDCYYYGKGVEADKAEAVKWFQKAADQGDSDAQCWLGDCYFYGQGVEADKAEAVKWFQKAADQGCSDAQGRLELWQ
eukprot:COSAG02_NODE_7248_length_3097_cov_22.393596_1_plen_490_part_00